MNDDIRDRFNVWSVRESARFARLRLIRIFAPNTHTVKNGRMQHLRKTYTWELGDTSVLE